MAVVLAATAVLSVVAIVVVQTRPPGLDARWRLQAGGPVVGAAEVDGETVFVATRAGALVSIEAETGQARWRFETGERILASPVAGQGFVYVTTEVSGSGTGRLLSIDARTGSELWRADLEEPATGRPVTGGGLVVVSAGDIVAFDAVSGQERWRGLAEVPVESLTAAFGLVVASDPSGLTALDEETGAQHWRVRTSGLLPVTPVAAGDHLVASDGAGALVGRDLEDGAERWRVPDAGLVQPPVAAGPWTVLSTAEGVAVISSATGERAWQVGPVGADEDEGARVATDGSVVVAVSDGRVVLFDASSGEVLGETDLASEGRATPAVGSGRVYIAEGDTVEAFDRPAG